jgi:hypothetical protein
VFEPSFREGAQRIAEAMVAEDGAKTAGGVRRYSERKAVQQWSRPNALLDLKKGMR